MYPPFGYYLYVYAPSLATQPNPDRWLDRKPGFSGTRPTTVRGFMSHASRWRRTSSSRNSERASVMYVTLFPVKAHFIIAQFW